uniref:Translin-associated protein X-like n=1 Tax=Phallusia mammillata TaxID=59560 RepID=A0A6F9DVY7_9ASCI|nr:translin-associated protein X-like [Phallusia mammillata]
MAQDSDLQDVSANDVNELFGAFRKELDARYDLHEKVVKISRDVTIESKRLIFLLHRIDFTAEKLENSLQQAKEKHLFILEKLKKVAVLLKDVDTFQFVRAFSAGLQEFIEATAFMFFIEKCNEVNCENICSIILSMHQVTDFLSFSDETDSSKTVRLEFPVEEYLLGIADVTGEMMRLCINSSASSLGQKDLSKSLSFKLTAYVQALHNAFSIFVHIVDVSQGLRKHFDEKLRTMTANVKKCEDVCYTLRLRGHEMPHDILKATLMEATEK